MDVVRYEWKKLMRHSKVFWMIMAFVILKVLELMVSHGPGMAEAGRYSSSYGEYLSVVEGRVDEGTAEFFSAKDEEFSRAESLLQTIYQKYSSGEWTEEEYRSRLGELERLMATKEGYDVLYSQYLYARENPKNRYLLDTNAWEALISKESLDMGLLFVIMISAAACFGRENVSEMDTIIRMSVNGGRKTAAGKILLVILLSSSLCILDFCIQAAFFHWGYGFGHGDYPVQSLEFGSAYEGDMSLTGAAESICLFRMAGGVLWGLIAGAAVVVLKNYALSMSAALSLILLPYYALPRQHMKYFLPGPLGFLLGAGYCRGTVSEYDGITGREVYQFIQVPGHTKLLLAAANLLLGVLLAGIILKSYTNHWSEKTRGCRAGVFLAILICTPWLGGCAGRTDAPKMPEILYNLDNRYCYESEDYLVYVDYHGEEGAYIAVREKEGGGTYPLVRDVFRGNKNVSAAFYGEGNRIYYMERSYDNKDRYFSSLYDVFSVVCVDLDTFESRVVFRDNANQNRTSVLGLGRIGKGAAFYSDIVAFVVRDDRIYFISSGRVSEVNILSGGRKTLFFYYGGNVAYDGNGFFFLDDMSRLCRYSLKENREEAVGGIVAGKFWLEGDRVIYTDRERGGALTAFRFGTQGAEGELSKKVLVWEEPLTFCSDGNNIFFIPKREAVIYELENGEGSPKEVGAVKSAMIYPFSSYGSIFVPDVEGGGAAEYPK